MEMLAVSTSSEMVYEAQAAFDGSWKQSTSAVSTLPAALATSAAAKRHATKNRLAIINPEFDRDSGTKETARTRDVTRTKDA